MGAAVRSADGVIGAIIDGHDQVLAAVRAAEPRIAELVEAAADRTRVSYVGAGTGGRLAAMDACEWGPLRRPGRGRGARLRGPVAAAPANRLLG